MRQLKWILGGLAAIGLFALKMFSAGRRSADRDSFEASVKGAEAVRDSVEDAVRRNEGDNRPLNSKLEDRGALRD